MTRLSTNKNIIVSGCSFTNWGGYNWPDALNKHDISLHNVGHKGNCNENIIKKSIEKTMSIPKDESVALIIQLTGLERVMIDGVISPTIRSLYETKSKFNWFGMSNKESIGRFKDYFENVYTPELHLNNLFKDIVYLQEKLKNLKNVDYRIICGWEIFCVNRNNMWSKDIRYINKNAKLLIDEYPKCKDLWDKINFKKFWFFENNFVYYGGISQWIQYNLEPEDWYRNYSDNDFHPSKSGHKKFGEVVIQPLVNQIFNQLEREV